MLTRRKFGLAAGAEGFRAHADEETMTGTIQFEITKSLEEWRKILTPGQFYVLRLHGTERAGTSPLDKNNAPGTYD